MFLWQQPTTKEFSLTPEGKGEMDSSEPGLFLVREAETVFCLSITFLHNPFFFCVFTERRRVFSPLITDKDLAQYWSKVCELLWKYLVWIIIPHKNLCACDF